MVRRQLPQLSLGMGSETEQMDLENIKFLHIEKKGLHSEKSGGIQKLNFHVRIIKRILPDTFY
jgi:hypothetical protein